MQGWFWRKADNNHKPQLWQPHPTPNLGPSCTLPRISSSLSLSPRRCDMSLEHPAVHLGTTDSPMAAAAEVHELDKAQMRSGIHEVVAGQGIRQSPQTVHLTNSNLELSQVQNARALSNHLGPASPLIRTHSHDVVETENQAGACVRLTIKAHNPVTSSNGAMNEGNKLNPGKTPNYLGIQLCGDFSSPRVQVADSRRSRTTIYSRTTRPS